MSSHPKNTFYYIINVMYVIAANKRVVRMCVGISAEALRKLNIYIYINFGIYCHF